MTTNDIFRSHSLQLFFYERMCFSLKSFLFRKLFPISVVTASLVFLFCLSVRIFLFYMCMYMFFHLNIFVGFSLSLCFSYFFPLSLSFFRLFSFLIFCHQLNFSASSFSRTISIVFSNEKNVKLDWWQYNTNFKKDICCSQFVSPRTSHRSLVFLRLLD